MRPLNPTSLKRGFFVKNATLGYSLAALSVLIAAGLFIAGWTTVGSGFGLFGILNAIQVASAHGHLSKRSGNDNINMRRPNRQYVGFILIAVAILAAALVQWVGPGLVAVEHPPLPPPTVTADGTLKMVTGIQKTRFHYALLPLAALLITGFILAALPTNDENNH